MFLYVGILLGLQYFRVYSEEISFYQGSVREEQNIRNMFGRLVSELAYTSLIGLI